MLKPRTLLPLLTLLLGLASLFTSCSKADDPAPAAQPEITPSALTATTTWRLDEIQQNGQVTSSGAGIKDRYSLSFRTDNSYAQKMLADNATYPGTWMLMASNTILHLLDHKGDDHEYKLTGLTAQQLRYRWTNKDGKQEELIFSAQP
ncbi:hypothetical protein [Hymenobacter persicinus]|uniref:Lipocalin-like domain-containing protein n=1 Tax=Hymenobacter persicinus TaxID=2025506 RepID=A0A4V1ZAR4_9BACT|nr:hypothetical protein [Hymenobacter persicinus]RYU79453.1 hypothetical protein EWM57_10935 [Hymenobacter persicinus]